MKLRWFMARQGIRSDDRTRRTEYSKSSCNQLQPAREIEREKVEQRRGMVVDVKSRETRQSTMGTRLSINQPPEQWKHPIDDTLVRGGDFGASGSLSGYTS